MDRVIVFTRIPRAGRVKTRLIPALGPQGAAALHARLAERVLTALAPLRDRRRTQVEVRLDGGDPGEGARWLGPAWTLAAQGPGDLGARMARAFQDAFAAGAARAVLVGTDAPGVDAPFVEGALARLDDADVVLGPAEDGGYTLVGLRRPHPGLFEAVPWGTERVLAETRTRASGLGLSARLLPALPDVDRPEDLRHLPEDLEAGLPLRDAVVSVIVPALNEEERIGAAVKRLLREEGVEVVVADGGSADGTAHEAREAGARVVVEPANRGVRLNAGARAARGAVLLFLHADARLPAGFPGTVRALLDRAGVAGGAFRLRIEGPGPALRLVEGLANVRTRLFSLPYGDQALFLRAGVFRALGGFRPFPLMEDYEFAGRLRRRGRIAVASQPVLASARRWERLGLWRATWVTQAVIAGYHAGVSPEVLAVFYRQYRRASGTG